MKNWQNVKTDKIQPYELNAKKHDPQQIANVARSIQAYGWAQPIVVDKDYTVIIGHCRLMAAKQLGMKEVPVVVRDDLTPDQVKELRILDNKLNESEWIEDILAEDIQDLDLAAYGIGDIGETGESSGHFWDEEAEDTEESKEFEEKFKPKKTTDDCYTPGNIYQVVKDWAVDHYHLEGREVLRPFYPGGDYEHMVYPENCVVIDNPPFSIISEIARFYMTNGIAFFLFAPALTLFSIASGECSYIPCGASVTFENGAVVSISFITNLSQFKIEGSHELYSLLKAADYENTHDAAELPNYSYPDAVITPACVRLIKYCQDIRIRAEDAVFIRRLDSQAEDDKAIFGGGFLLSEKAAAEKAAAEKAAAEKAAAGKAAAEKAAARVWLLSEREKDIQKALGADKVEVDAE